MRGRIIRFLGGIYLKDATEQERQAILTEAIPVIFNIGQNDILRFEAGRWYYQDKPLTDLQLSQLGTETRAFQSTGLYRILDTDLRYQGAKRMNEAVTLPQLEGAKLLIFLADILKTRLNILSSLHPLKP